MFSKLVKYVSNCEIEALEILDIEDLAICWAWYDSLDSAPQEREHYSGLKERIDHWVAEAKLPESSTEGRRQQPFLRDLVAQLRSVGTAELQGSEAALGLKILALMERFHSPERYKRLADLLAPYGEDLQQHVEIIHAAPGLSDIEHRLRYVTDEEIRTSRPRFVSSFAGVSLPGQGPVYQSSGDVKVLGNVPEDCMLVVEKGSCYVGGYVMGRIAVKNNCEVRENIAGVAISREGDIRARNIVNRAFVVAKNGSLFVRGAESPKLSYAGKEIQIGGSAIMGIYAAPSIEITGDAHGGEYSVSNSLKVGHIRRSESRHTNIILRRRVSCEDYGEIVGPEASRILGNLSRARQRRANISNLKSMTKREREHFATNAILFMLGGDSLSGALEQVDDAHRRFGFLNRVIAAVDALMESVEDQLKATTEAERPAPSKATAEDSPYDTFNELEAELAQLEEEIGVQDGISEDFNELAGVGRGMKKAGTPQKLPPGLLSRLRRKKVTWLLERDRLLKQLERQEESMQKLSGSADLLKRSGDGASRVELLTRLVLKANGRSFDDPLGKRSRSNFVQYMLRSIEMRTDRLKKYDGQLDEIDQKISRESHTLITEYSVTPPQPVEDKDLHVSVQARFDAGVRLVTERYLIGMRDVPEGSVIFTPDSGPKERCYIRNSEGISTAT